MKYISILGSTGSIGKQALDVIGKSNQFRVVGLSANENIELLEKQALEFRPQTVAVGNPQKARLLKEKLKLCNIKVVGGIEGLIEVATIQSADIVLTSVVGMVGLVPTLEAIKAEKTIALANKETLVTAGELVTKTAKEKNVKLIPVDSEHSAIHQCLASGNENEVSRIILTASGGPFKGKKREEIENVTYKEALKHPNWSMGKKISIDSATLMNKGLEVIEAKWLFDISLDKIDVIIHPQSIIHSMVEFIDGSVIAQLGIPDMRIPIQYALTYPKRESNNLQRLDLVKYRTLSFESPDVDTFPCLQLAIDSLKEGGTMPTVLNASNEVAVELFLKGKIKFYDIPKLIEKAMGSHNKILNPTLEQIIDSDKWARNKILLDYNR